MNKHLLDCVQPGTPDLKDLPKAVAAYNVSRETLALAPVDLPDTLILTCDQVPEMGMTVYVNGAAYYYSYEQSANDVWYMKLTRVPR